MEWPRKGTPVERGHDEVANMECNAFGESINAMAEEMELKWASWGECARQKNVGPAGPFSPIRNQKLCECMRKS